MNIKTIELVEKCMIKALEPPPDMWFVNYCEQWYSPYYGLMYYLAKELNPELCVETGVHNGRGSASIASGTKNQVIGIDHARHPNIIQVIDKFSNFKFINASSTDPSTISTVKSLNKKIGLLHLDTEHSYAQVINEFNTYLPMLDNHAIILFDDVNAMDGAVMQAAKTLPLVWLKQDDRLHPSCGYAVGIMPEVSNS